MDSLKEKRIAVKFCVKLGKSATETFAMLITVYDDVSKKRIACFKWHECFKVRLTTMSVLGVVQHQLTTHTLTKSTLRCAQIDV